MLISILLTIAGFALLIKCADFFVMGAASFARNLKVSTAVIGLTVVAFGTSAPELAISFSSHITGNVDMLFGNVIGSNIGNILLILGLAIVIKPIKCHDNLVYKEIPILMLVTMGASVLILDNLFDFTMQNSLARSDGIILILLFGVFAYYLVTLLAKDKNKTMLIEKPKWKIPKSTITMIAGLAGIIVGSNLIVDNLASIAEAIGISQKVISVTIVSIGTSLPELVTTVTAAKKGEHGMAIGNIIGSNLFNTGIVLGLPVVILGGAATTAFNIIDAAFMLFAVILLWVFASSDRLLKRREGLVFLGVYATYLTYVLLYQ